MLHCGQNIFTRESAFLLEFQYIHVRAIIYYRVTEIYLHIVEKCLFLFGMILIDLGCISAPGKMAKNWFSTLVWPPLRPCYLPVVVVKLVPHSKITVAIKNWECRKNYYFSIILHLYPGTTTITTNMPNLGTQKFDNNPSNYVILICHFWLWF